MSEQYSRRDLFRKVFSPIISAAHVADDLRSEHDNGSRPLDIANKGSEYGVEATLVLLSIYSALEAGKQTKYFIHVSPKDVIGNYPGQVESMQGVVSGLNPNMVTLKSNAIGLDDKWRHFYHKSRTVYYWTTEQRCTGTGSDRKCTTHSVQKSRTEYYWDEPSQFTDVDLDRDRISNWKDVTVRIKDRLTDLHSVVPRLPTLAYGNEGWNYELTAIDQNSADIFRVIAFGGTGLAFSFYEELISHLSRVDLNSPEFLNTLSQKKIKRRSFMKFVGGVLALSQVNKLQKSFATRNSQVLDATQERIQSESDRVDKEIGLTDEEVIQEYLGASVPELVTKLSSIESILTRALSVNGSRVEDWNDVRPLLEHLRTSTQVVLADVKSTFHYQDNQQYSLPENLIMAMRLKIAKDRINDFVESRNTTESMAVLQEIALYVMLITGIAVGAETLLGASDIALDNVIHF